MRQIVQPERRSRYPLTKSKFWLSERVQTFGRRRSNQRHEKVAFVLSGGGAKGACQVGMLEALSEAGIAPDVIIGVSIGALNGAMAAAIPGNVGTQRLKEIWSGLSTKTLLRTGRLPAILRYTMKRESAFPKEPLIDYFRSTLPISDLSETEIPLEVLLTDVKTGEGCWFNSGPAPELLYGSAAIPGVLPPISYQGRSYVDGGVVDNTPVRRAVQLGATTIYVLLCQELNPSLPYGTRPLEVMLRTVTLTKAEQFRTALQTIPEDIDVIIIDCPNTYKVDLLDFSHSVELIALGLERGRYVLNSGARSIPEKTKATEETNIFSNPRQPQPL
jgi:NTE family protein